MHADAGAGTQNNWQAYVHKDDAGCAAPAPDAEPSVPPRKTAAKGKKMSAHGAAAAVSAVGASASSAREVRDGFNLR